MTKCTWNYVIFKTTFIIQGGGSQISTIGHLTTVPTSSVATKPILCTESPNYTMLFYYIKMRTSFSPSHPFLQLTGALK